MIPLLLSLCLALPDPNMAVQDFAAHWLSPGKIVQHVFLFEGVTPFTWTQVQSDGTILVIKAQSEAKITVTGTKYRPVNYLDFAAFAMVYPGDPNYVKPVEPNLPPEPNLADVLAGAGDPNLIEAIKEMMK